jgi:hypothetical protein
VPQPHKTKIEEMMSPPAPEPHEIEIQRKLELLRNVRVTREKVGMNRWGLNEAMADPTKVYKGVNRNPARMTEYIGLGYQVCRRPHLTPHQQEDGSHVRGDLILMEVDKDLYEALCQDSVIRGYEQIEGEKEKFADAVVKAGGLPYGLAAR